MLPEMFCRANACACRPDTAVVNASKIPMTLPLQLDPQRHELGPRRMAQRRAPPSNLRAMVFIVIYQYLIGTSRLRLGAGYADLSADIAGLERFASRSGGAAAPCERQVRRVLIRRNHRTDGPSCAFKAPAPTSPPTI